MKAILGVLLCYVFFSAQCFAIDGGPVYPTPTLSPSATPNAISNVVITGTFAGVLLPNAKKSPGSNSIAIFSVPLPTSGLGSGPLVIFQTGETYTGTLQGIADPDSAKFYGLIDATFPLIITTPAGIDSNGQPVFTTTTVVATASGRLNGQLIANPLQGSTASTRITGTADVQFSQSVNRIDSEIIYDVFGFRQGD